MKRDEWLPRAQHQESLVPIRAEQGCSFWALYASTDALALTLLRLLLAPARSADSIPFAIEERAFHYTQH